MSLVSGANKCFGIKRNGKQSSQFKPYLKVNNEIIPAVKLNDSFVYLGKEFSFELTSKRSLYTVNLDGIQQFIFCQRPE